MRHLGGAEAELVRHALGRGAGFFVGPVQVRQDAVHPVAHPVHRGCHLVPGGPELLDLDPEPTAARGQVGEHPAPRFLHLVQERPALVLGAGDDGLSCRDGLGNDALALHPGLLFCVGHQ